MRPYLAFFALIALAADPKPNFSGTWSLNVGKSDFGGSPAPKSMITRIEHKEPQIQVQSKVNGPQGEYTTEYKFVTDGRENSNNVRGSDIKSHVYWEASALKVSARAVNGNSQVEFLDDWNLSADRKTLTMTRTISAPQGKVLQRYVYEK